MEGPAINIIGIESLGIAVKDGKMKIGFEATLSSADTARLINFARQARPMNIIS